MFSKLTRFTLVLGGAAGLALGGYLSSVVGGEAEASPSAVLSVQPDMSEALADQSVMACSSLCTGYCKRCILGVCEDICQ
ncbi:hypothetical protein JY651_50745 [Pyxidicoccus parkwayensis]|jgi:hypothetical protein|uniref:Uncharacterized protein n=1 Tax=Pyxidicoccus parkwayensis TaxID=2813578 RepID=A0ABX7NX30_9BACT|nr:hypothetical protein [Pyxidicoccus parkwaysis]QSQ23268.1 hypothetical protein JY651_50745 [Pyxidicoccus parkwaysis]